MDVRLFLLVLCSVSALCDPEYVIRKRCKDVDPGQCRVHSVAIDPCPRGPNFCIIKPDKFYSVNVDFTPGFTAKALKLGMYSDERKTDSFTTALKAPQDGCELTHCPLQTNERRTFNFHFQMAKLSPGKFPLKVKLWNEEDPSQACCFTFNAKIRK